MDFSISEDALMALLTVVGVVLILRECILAWMESRIIAQEAHYDLYRDDLDLERFHDLAREIRDLDDRIEQLADAIEDREYGQ